MTARRRDIDLANWPVAILAGGLATRLRPATDKIPKALLSVAGEPFLIHQLRLLHSEGFLKILQRVGCLAELVAGQFGFGKRVGRHLGCPYDWQRLLQRGVS